MRQVRESCALATLRRLPHIAHYSHRGTTKAMGSLKNLKHEAFCREYCKSRNATDAYRKAGYAPNKADANAIRLIVNDGIKPWIAELEAYIAEKVMFDAVAVVQRYVDIATADPNDLIQNRVGSCRYCHGRKHQYQWRTREEFDAAACRWMTIHDYKKVHANSVPSDEGGYGYLKKRAPHQDCPNCEVFGENYIVVPDTMTLSRQARALLAGVEKTRDGLKIKMHDQLKALEMVGKHLGVFKVDNKQKASPGDALAQFLIERINTVGSKAVLNRDGLDD